MLWRANIFGIFWDQYLCESTGACCSYTDTWYFFNPTNLQWKFQLRNTKGNNIIIFVSNLFICIRLSVIFERTSCMYMNICIWLLFCVLLKTPHHHPSLTTPQVVLHDSLYFDNWVHFELYDKSTAGNVLCQWNASRWLAPVRLVRVTVPPNKEFRPIRHKRRWPRVLTTYAELISNNGEGGGDLA